MRGLQSTAVCVYSEVPLGAAEMILAFLCSLEQFLRQNKNAESILASLWRKEPSECLQGKHSLSRPRHTGNLFLLEGAHILRFFSKG